jgi:antitoxin VapB
MKTARIFANGRSQAIRLPKEYRFKGTEVYVKKFDNVVMLFQKGDPWAPFIDSLGNFTEDFLSDRNQPEPQKRRGVQ